MIPNLKRFNLYKLKVSFHLICHRLLFCFFLLICSGSCGYRFNDAEIPKYYKTISVPYVINDSDGYLTQSVIRAISVRHGPRYTEGVGDLILQIELIDLYDENIGFRYDRNHKGKLTRCIIPTESRAIAIAEVQLIDSCKMMPIFGPVRITESLDFDHDYYETRGKVNVLSLGQVTDLDSARDAVETPLYRLLANKIIEYVYESW